MIRCAGIIRDIDSNVYQTIKIGNQVWTVSNLLTTRYNDGSPILNDTSNTSWCIDSIGKYCFYNNTCNSDSIKKFGARYNWAAVSPYNENKLAPSGWHVPTKNDWDTLAESPDISSGF
jgi:uncharacterized protein (TIGR02145 family)